MVERAELLFSEVLNAISQIAAKGFRRRIGELEELLQREKAEFEVIIYVLKIKLILLKPIYYNYYFKTSGFVL